LERLWSAIEAATIKLRKKKRLLKLFAHSGVDGILHGHVHRHEAYIRKKVQCFNGGGTTVPAENGQRMINYFSFCDGKMQHRMLPVKLISGRRRKLAINRRIITTAA
jgi:predicted phosphodiesterase